MANLSDNTLFKVESTYCFLCGDAAIPIIPPHKLGTTENTLLQNWTYECTRLLPEALEIDPSLQCVFQSKGYCSQCLNTVREINFLHKSIKSFQKRLSHFCKSVKNSLRNQAEVKGLMKSCSDVESESIDAIIRLLLENQNGISTPLLECYEFLDPVISPNPSTNDEEQLTLYLFPDKRSIPKDPLAYHQKLRKIAPKPPSTPVLLIHQPLLLHQPTQSSNPNNTVQIQNTDKEQTWRYPCTWAGCKFIAYTKECRLTFHVNKVHLKDPTPYHCTNLHCTKKFPTASHLRGHAQIHKDKSIKNKASTTGAEQVHELDTVAFNEAELTKSPQVEEINIELKEENVLSLIEAESENYYDDGSSSNQATTDPLSNFEKEYQEISSNQTKEIVRNRCTWPECKYISYGKECRLIFHINRIHLQDPKPYHCQNCDLKFVSYNQLRGHCNKHTTRTSHTNKIIPKSLTNIVTIDLTDDDQYKGFVRNSTDSNRLQRLVERKKRLHKHVFQKTITTSSKKFPCTFPGCSKKLLSCARALQNHQRLKHNYVEPTITKKFPCEFPGCTKQLSHVSSLQRHQLRQHNHVEPTITKKFPCKFPGCTIQLSHAWSLQRHLRVNHNHVEPTITTKKFPCTFPGCTKKLSHARTLQHHLRVKHNYVEPTLKTKKFPCTFPGCSKKLSHARTLQHHQRVKHNYVEPYQRLRYCKFCAMTFKEKDAILEHLKEAHNDEIPACDRKGPPKMINRRRLLMNNTAMTAPSPEATQIPCNLCAFLFERQNEKEMEIHLQIHKQREIENRKFSCVVENCDKFFVNSFHLKAHVLAEHCVIGIQCQYCSNVLSNMGTLKAHMKSFHGSDESSNLTTRKYIKCSICSFKAINKSVLRDHMGSHSADSRFSCTKCSETFRYRQNLRHHMIRHLPKEQWPFQCTFSGCNAAFVISAKFKTHEESHSATKTYICEYCSNSYRTQRYLSTHIRVVHKIRKRTETYITHKTLKNK